MCKKPEYSYGNLEDAELDRLINHNLITVVRCNSQRAHIVPFSDMKVCLELYASQSLALEVLGSSLRYRVCPSFVFRSNPDGGRHRAFLGWLLGGASGSHQQASAANGSNSRLFSARIPYGAKRTKDDFP